MWLAYVAGAFLAVAGGTTFWLLGRADAAVAEALSRGGAR